MILQTTIRGRLGDDDELIDVIGQSQHRNGVGGVPLVVSLFDKAGNRPGDLTQHMVGISFLTGENGTKGGNRRQRFIDHTAVLDIGLLFDGVITMGDNSWRGSDLYGPVLADAWEKVESEKYPDLPVWDDDEEVQE